MTWVLIGFCVCMAARTASAQAQPSGANGEYQNLVQQALHEYQLGNFSEARAFFARAHELSPNARTLRGLGMSAYELRNYVEAIDYFQRSLSSTERPLTAQMQREITQLLTQARSFVTRLQLRVRPANAELRIDTRAVTREADGTVLLDPGTHELAVEAPDYEPATRTLRTNGSETLTLNISLRSTASPQARLDAPTETSETIGLGSELPDTSQTATSPSQPESHTGHDGSEGSGAVPWILIGAGGAVAVAGGVLLAIALSNKSAVERPSGEAPRWNEYSGRNDTVYPLSFAGITALSVGAATAIGGVIWKVAADGARTPERAQAELQLTPTGLRLRGRF